MDGRLFHVACPPCAAEYVGRDDDAAWALFEDHGRRGHDVALETLDAAVERAENAGVETDAEAETDAEVETDAEKGSVASSTS